MPFVSTANNGGVPDPNISKSGRPKSGNEKKLTKREAKDKEFLSLVRRLRPHVAVALNEAVKILRDEKATESGKLRASVIILSEYRTALKEAYSGNDVEDSMDNEVGDDTPVLSLKIVGDK